MLVTNAIDGDTLIYQACFACERTIYDLVPADKVEEGQDYEEYAPFIIDTFERAAEVKTWLKDRDVTQFRRMSRKVMEPLSHTLHILNTAVRDVYDAVGADHNILYLSDPVSNFRAGLAHIKEYKESRKDKPKPVYYKQAEQFLLDNWDAKVMPNLEADDAVAIIASSAGPEDVVFISTIDKDLNQVPGWKYNYKTKKFHYVTSAEGLRFFYTQLLMGDSTDSIPGIPGVGPKKAEKLLVGCVTEEEMVRVCLEQYTKAYGGEGKYAEKVGRKIMLEQGQLLWMMREPGKVWEIPL
jgi:5'-3' exonuclease